MVGSRKTIKMLNPLHPLMIKAESDLGKSGAYSVIECVSYALKYELSSMNTRMIVNSCRVQLKTAEKMLPHVNAIISELK